MTADVEMAGSTSRSAPAGQAADELAPNTGVAGGRYVIESLSHRGPLAEIYQARDTGAGVAVSVHRLSRPLTANAGVRQAVTAAARAAVAIDHKNVLRTVDVVDEAGQVLVVTELVDGNPLRELLERKRATGSVGFGVRGAGNIVAAVCAGLAVAHDYVAHGSVSTDSVFVNRAGRVTIVGFGIGAAHPAAARAGLASADGLAPEAARAGAATPDADVFGIGRVLYEVLVGHPLAKGGKRPSQAIEGLTSAIDEVVARCCAPAPDKRYAAGELRAAVTDALAKRAEPQRPSLAHSIARPVSAAQSAQMPAQSGSMAAATSGSMAAATSGSMAAQTSGAFDNPALADTEEKWLISKGKLDFGPFSLADIVDQIGSNEIVPGNFIVDSHTGERWNVEDHPLLSRLVDHARQRRDDQRRAEAEVHHARSEKTRGIALYLFIAAGVAAVAVVAYLVVSKTKKADEADTGNRLASVGESDIAIKVSAAKKAKPTHKSSGKSSGKRRSSGGGGGGGGGDEDDVLALDMNSDLGDETLSMGTVNQYLRGAHGALGRCMAKTGSQYAAISFIIKGPTGRVVWVRVNGKGSGALYSCIKSALQGVKFPTVDGPRTKAEFDISL